VKPDIQVQQVQGIESAPCTVRAKESQTPFNLNALATLGHGCGGWVRAALRGAALRGAALRGALALARRSNPRVACVALLTGILNGILRNSYCVVAL
jgi:hypothetical protein